MSRRAHLKLNIGERPIANKYREGKMKRTLKRELKGLEIAKREPLGRSVAAVDIAGPGRPGPVPSAACRSASARWPGGRPREGAQAPCFGAGVLRLQPAGFPCRPLDRGMYTFSNHVQFRRRVFHTGPGARDDSVLVPRAPASGPCSPGAWSGC